MARGNVAEISFPESPRGPKLPLPAASIGQNELSDVFHMPGSINDHLLITVFGDSRRNRRSEFVYSKKAAQVSRRFGRV